MAKKGKAKISKVKRNNQTTNKMKKQGKLKLQRHRGKLQKQRQAVQPQKEWSSDSESASADEWGDMLDEEEQQYIVNRLAKQPHLLANVPQQEENENKSSKRKRSKEKMSKPIKPVLNGDSGAESDAVSSDVEDKYEREIAERPVKRLRPLLPIKTKDGLQERAEEYNDTESEQEEQQEQQTLVPEQHNSDTDSGLEGTPEEDLDGEVVSAVQLLATRRDRLNHEKLRIGALCSSMLESPDKKLKNFFPILYFMEEHLKDGALNLLSVRKIATLSAYEVFKDILPEYNIRHQDYSNVKLKKDTLALYKYEKELLEFYKRYLQRLEKATGILRRRKGHTRKPDETSVGLALISLRCMCGLLTARPHFNYATNLAQSLVPMLDCGEQRATDIVTECCTSVFREDNKGEITLVIVRLINQLVKRRGERLNPTALDCLLTLKIRDVDLDGETELKHKKKQDEKHKKRIVNLSKKEKKRAKKLKEVERELLETEAQESEMARKKQLTEVTKTVFHIYFRLLKNSPRSKLLAAALDGLAKFTHVINLEYYSDLVAILSRLVDDDVLAVRERLLCVRSVLGMLAGAGDALNVDPAKFHNTLYANVLGVHAGATQTNAKVVLEAISQICARARRVSPAILQAFAKRLATLATQLQHHGALASLALLQQLAQHKCVSSLLESEPGAGSGRFDPALPSAEHCNPHAAALHELCVLRRHYHPTTRSAADKLLQDQSSPVELNKLSPARILDQYDGSQMAFKPSIPPPKQSTNHRPAPAHAWTQPEFKHHCESVESAVDMKCVQFFGCKARKS